MVEAASSREVDHRKLLMTVEEAAQCLSIGRSQCYQLVMRGEIASIKLGRSRRILVTALEQFVQERLECERDVALACEDSEGGNCH